MIRVRFAPSPTGSLHVGVARTALFNWLLVRNARKSGGQASFVLRIEDTDKQRSTDAFTQTILDGMTWLGLSWDEGPSFQATGLERHRADADRLLKEGKAYEEEGAIRFKVVHEEVAWDDLVHGRITFHGKDLEDFIILRADRTPVYNFAVVSDDVDQRITHVLRGDDHVSNTPKQILLYRALGVEPPLFGHLPMILGEDHKKLSKRHGATAVADYQHQDILPQAMVNYLALLGWSPGGDRELFFTMDELVDAFSVDGILKKASVFDPQKLRWVNTEHLRHLSKHQPKRFHEMAVLQDPSLKVLDPAVAEVTLTAVAGRSWSVTGAIQQAKVLHGLAPVILDDKAATAVAKDPEAHRHALALVLGHLKALSDWSPPTLEAELRKLAESHGMKAGAVMQPVRIALTGSTVSMPVNELLSLIGKDGALERLAKAAG